MKGIILPVAMVLLFGVTAAAQSPCVSPGASAVCGMLLAQAAPDTPMMSGRQGPGPGQGGRMPGMRQMRHLEQFRLLKLLELLDLKEDQEAQFISKYRQMRKDERDDDQKERDLVGRLADLIKQSKASEKTLTAMADSIINLQEQSWRARQERLGQFKAILSGAQWAKFIIFHERFEQQMLEQLRGFREREAPEPDHREDSTKQKFDDDKF